MNVAYLLIGGNMGNRPVILAEAKAAIGRNCGKVTAQSAIYETAAWGLEDQDSFLNQALELHTPLTAEDLLECLLDIEAALGRVRQEKYGPRLIDIDILLYNNAVIELDGLKVPHPQLPYRRFALVCLADIAGNKIHPLLHQNIQDLLAQCADPLEVNKFN
jgi:2-amino-4-hydroxy-6-hydroxymethyldihydropteridine diphosphokinase